MPRSFFLVLEVAPVWFFLRTYSFLSVQVEYLVLLPIYLKRVMSDRKVTHPPSREWKQVLISEETDWVEFKGLWGVKSLLADESGPPGPKWDRPDRFFIIYPRKRWERPLEWLRELYRGR